MFDENFLSMVRCPATHQRLQMAEESLMQQLRAAIDEKRIVNRLGERIEQAPEAALINEQRTLIYPVHDGIPTLLADEAIEMAQLDAQRE